MSQLFINVIGFNASGKTHIAKKLEERFKLNRISGDDFRLFVYDHIRYFHEVNNSYPTEKNKILSKLVLTYRFEFTWLLLKAGQNIIFDGSGATKEQRARYLDKIKSDFPDVKTVIILCQLDEPTLLKRLAERDKTSGARWTEMYHDVRKKLFEPPSEDEADQLLHYDQINYEQIEKAIAKLL